MFWQSSEWQYFRVMIEVDSDLHRECVFPSFMAHKKYFFFTFASSLPHSTGSLRAGMNRITCDMHISFWCFSEESLVYKIFLCVLNIIHMNYNCAPSSSKLFKMYPYFQRGSSLSRGCILTDWDGNCSWQWFICGLFWKLVAVTACCVMFENGNFLKID